VEQPDQNDSNVFLGSSRTVEENLRAQLWPFGIWTAKKFARRAASYDGLPTGDAPAAVRSCVSPPRHKGSAWDSPAPVASVLALADGVSPHRRRCVRRVRLGLDRR